MTRHLRRPFFSFGCEWLALFSTHPRTRLPPDKRCIPFLSESILSLVPEDAHLLLFCDRFAGSRSRGVSVRVTPNSPFRDKTFDAHFDLVVVDILPSRSFLFPGNEYGGPPTKHNVPGAPFSDQTGFLKAPLFPSQGASLARHPFLFNPQSRVEFLFHPSLFFQWLRNLPRQFWLRATSPLFFGFGSSPGMALTLLLPPQNQLFSASKTVTTPRCYTGEQFFLPFSYKEPRFPKSPQFPRYRLPPFLFPMDSTTSDFCFTSPPTTSGRRHPVRDANESDGRVFFPVSRRDGAPTPPPLIVKAWPPLEDPRCSLVFLLFSSSSSTSARKSFS